MNEDTVHCLIIDDNEEVLKSLKLLLGKLLEFELGTRKVNCSVKVETVNIGCYLKDGKPYVHERVLALLLESINNKPHFIFSDFAWVAEQKLNEEFRKSRLQSKESFSIEDCRPFTVYLTDLGEFDKKLTKALAAYKGVVFAYTHAFPPFDQLFSGTERNTRLGDLMTLFPKTATPPSLYNLYDVLQPDERVIAAMSESEFKVLTSNVLGMRLEMTLFESIYREQVAKQHRSHARLTKAGFRFVTTVGVIVGGITALLGDILYQMFRTAYLMVGPDSWGAIFGQVAYALCVAVVGVVSLAWLARKAVRYLDSFQAQFYESAS